MGVAAHGILVAGICSGAGYVGKQVLKKGKKLSFYMLK